jgi:hypothetical protein
VGTAHLLLGFTCLEAGQELLRELGVDADELRPHIFAAIDGHPQRRSPRPQLPTAKPLSERMAPAYNLSSFTKRVEGDQAEAAGRVGERLWEGMEQATRMMFSGRGSGKPSAERLHAETRAIEMIDATLAEARGALSGLGIELPEQAPPG